MNARNQSSSSRRGFSMVKWLILLVVVAVVIFWGGGQYNRMVVLEENVNTSWSQVENQYQRRIDLIPNLVETVKGYASHERETLEKVIEARAKATQTTIDPTKMTEEQLAQFQQSQGNLGEALSRLMLLVERYPDLKANENFRQLQAQLEGTENRIATARMDFNQTAQIYNTSIRRVPMNIVARIFGFSPKPYFVSVEGADRAPEVKF